jgi:hypothetical protein
MSALPGRPGCAAKLCPATSTADPSRRHRPEVRQGAGRERRTDRHPAGADRAAAGEDRDHCWVWKPGRLIGITEGAASPPSLHKTQESSPPSGEDFLRSKGCSNRFAERRSTCARRSRDITGLLFEANHADIDGHECLDGKLDSLPTGPVFTASCAARSNASTPIAGQ